MPSKSSSRVSATKPSSSAAFPTVNPNKSHSTVIKSAFAPSHLQFSLFASTIRSLDSEQLRIHDTITGELKSVHTVSGTAINCIRWGSHKDHSSKKKKRKLDNGESTAANSGSTVIIIGTSKPEIQLFSPIEGRVIVTLENAHESGTRDFVISGSQEAWSLGIDGSLIQWNMETLEKLQTIRAPVASATRLITFSSLLLLASQSAYLYDPMFQELKTIPCFDQPIHTLISQSAIKNATPTLFLAAADSKSTIGVYDTETLTIKGNLNAEDEVSDISLFSRGDTSLLASICNGGSVEIFDSPFHNWPSPDDDIKTKRRKATRRSSARVEVRRPDKSAGIVSIIDATIDHEGTLILALAEGSVSLGFERLSVLNDDGSLSFAGIKTLTRAKSVALINESMNGVKNLRNAHVDESGVIVGDGAMGEDVVLEDPTLSAEELSESEEEDVQVTSTELIPINGDVNSDTEMADVENDEHPTEEPTFGDLVRARGIATVEVTGPQTSISTAKGINSISSNLTLGTLLTQALNTNDIASLDTCLAQQDVQIIRATIERLDSSLAIKLLQRLAERLHSRPGRAGSLLVWVQWSIIAHGGYLSSRPDTVKQLRSLHKVVQERAKSLQPLLALKGKLDMLDAQIAFRKKVHQNQLDSIRPSVRPEDMIYVEGQPESETEDEHVEGQESGQVYRDNEEDEEEKDDDDDDEGNIDPDVILDEDEEEDLSENDEDASGTELSEGNELENEVNHDDIDPEDSDASDTGLSSTRVNGIKH